MTFWGGITRGERARGNPEDSHVVRASDNVSTGRAQSLFRFTHRDRAIEGDVQKLGDQLRNEASLKRDGKIDLKPTSVKVFDMAAGRVVLYLFPMSNEITRSDHRVEFVAKIGRLDVDQSFLVDNMIWQSKLEL